MKPETRRLIGFGALAVGAHFLLLFDGFYTGSSRAYLSATPLVLTAQLAPRKAAGESLLPVKPREGIPDTSGQQEKAIIVTEMPVVAREAPKPPSASMSETPEVDEAAQLLDDIYLPPDAFTAESGDAIQVRVWVDKQGQASRIEVLNSQLAKDQEDEIVRQLVAARYRPAQKDGSAVASVITGALSPN
jgi:hypothetical protein